MRTLLICLLVAAAAHARYRRPKAAESSLVVSHEWKFEDLALRLGGKTYVIDLFWLADRVASNSICAGDYRAVTRKYMRELDPEKALIVELATKKKGGERFVAGLWPLTRERLEADLRLEARQVDGRIAVRLVNRGKVPHTVVRPGDGSESGWREPEIYFEQRVEKKRWVRGRAVGRCGMFANDWTRDTVVLAPGGALEIGAGFMPLKLTFDAGAKTLRARYAYRGERPKGIGPGAMKKTPPFELVSNPVRIK